MAGLFYRQATANLHALKAGEIISSRKLSESIVKAAVLTGHQTKRRDPAGLQRTKKNFLD
jgi:hypothetical protein